MVVRQPFLVMQGTLSDVEMYAPPILNRGFDQGLTIFRSISTISSATLSSAVLEVDPHLGAGHQTQAENLLP